VPPGQRAELHRRIAARQEAAYGEQVGEIAAELAHHYRHGNEKGKAIEYLGRAAQQALQRAAYADAISNFSSALELVQRQPDNMQRARQELNIQLGLGPALAAAKGFSAPEVERAYTRAQQLSERLGDAAQLFDALFGLLIAHSSGGRHAAAYQIAERLQRLAEAANDSGRLLLAHMAAGNIFIAIGDFLNARPHFEMAISLYDPERPRQFNLYGGDNRVNPRSNLGQILWSFGYPDRALQLGIEARAIAQSWSGRHSQAFAECIVTLLHSYRREARATQESAEHLIALSTENGLPLFLARGITLRGWAIALQGRYEEGIALIREGSAATRATGTEFTRLPDLLLLADACLEAGRFGEGLDALTEARTLVVRPEHRFSAMIEVSKGKLLTKLHGANAGEAENCFRSAIEIARKLNEKMTELQAATGLARLLASRGDRDEAHAILSGIYNWFTEGFDTADLIEAKTLLEELGQNQAVAANLNGRPPRGGLRRMRIQ
jgi:adenylate cyclase